MTTTVTETCPTCGQRMLVRHGVKLSPRLADFFDLIEQSGERGVLAEVLAWVFYPGKSKRDALRCVYTNINHLNDHLVETNVMVRAAGKAEPYKVIAKEIVT
jgi:hypothetical protein